jgi:hypothetical protein
MKRGFSTFLVFLVGIIMFSVSAFAFSGGGSGTLGDPYQINDCFLLNETRDDLTAFYVLNATFSCNVAPFNTGSGFEPIGDSVTPFAGSFDGAGFSIEDLFIDFSGSDFVGLFGHINGSGIVFDLSLVDIDVTGDINVGGLTGLNDGNISNVSVGGFVSGTNSVGGVVGTNYGQIEYASSSVEVNAASFYSGGLVGESYLGRITHSSASGDVTGSGSYFGGLIGYSESELFNCSASGIVNATSDYVGGLVGYSYLTMVSFSSASGNVYGNSDYVGGLVGYNDNTVVTNSSASGSVFSDVSNSDYVGGLVGINYRGNVTNSSASGYVEGQSYVGGLIGSSQGGSGFTNFFVSNSFATGNVQGLDKVGGLVGVGGGNYLNSYATGNVNGSIQVGGLLGRTGGFVNNSYATGNVTGDDQYVGGLVGYLDDGQFGTIKFSYATGIVTGGRDVGGLVGFSDAGVISRSYATGNVFGTGTSNGVGGFIGRNSDGDITYSYATGNVSAPTNTRVGGFCGANGGAITNAYARGSVDGDDNVGGFCGRCGDEIINAYSTGNVTGNTGVGGFLGFDNGCSVSSSFWDTETSGQATSALGTGQTTTQMKTQSTFSNAGWSFITTWAISGGTNNGYPYLDVRPFSPSVCSSTGVSNGSFSEITDTQGFIWDPEFSGGYLDNGLYDAYDGMYKLSVNGQDFTENFITYEESNQEFVFGAQTISGLIVTRKFLVVDGYGRYLEILKNPTGAAIVADIMIYGNLGSDGSTIVVNTSDGDDIINASDFWAVTDDSCDGCDDPSLGHVWDGPGGAKRIDDAILSGDDLEWSWNNVTIPAGQTYAFMYFAVQQETNAAAISLSELISANASIPAQALTLQEASYVQNWNLSICPAPSPAPSGGGGGGGSSASNSYASAAASASTDSVNTVSLKINQKHSFSVDSETHTMTLDSADATQAQVTIQSDPIVLTLEKGVLKFVDVNKDGRDDIRVRFDSYIKGVAKFYFEVLPKFPEPKMTSEPVRDVAPVQPPAPRAKETIPVPRLVEKGNNWIWVVLLLALVAGVGYYAYTQQNKRR